VKELATDGRYCELDRASGTTKRRDAQLDAKQMDVLRRALRRARFLRISKPANCTFGGADRRTLYITARANVYKVILNVPGLP
jgi:sugar lactone lactonase YvrE